MTKKVYKKKQLMTENSNWEILIKNLVTCKK